LLWPFRNPAFARVPWPDFYREQLELIAESEALGFDHAWLTEHHFIDDGYSPSLHTIAGAIAARTTRLRIGTCLLLLPLHDPILVAEDTATVDLLSDGRFDLGVGLGYRRAEFTAFGIPPSTRGARMEEALQIVSRLLGGESVTFAGRHHDLRDVRISPPAAQRPHPPLWVGAMAPQAIDRAARLGAHYLAGPLELVPHYDDALRRHGRDPAGHRVAHHRVLYVAPTREQAWEIAARPLHHITSLYLDWNLEAGTMPGYEGTTIPSVDEIIAAQSFSYFGQEAFIGTPADVAERLEDDCARARITDLVCAMPIAGMAPDDIRLGMRLLADEVMPRFRDRT
jgi:alkanesulfonate monooxygenase SsuD/methylene tetrahydromethanopterin reductase-like flavin-dependent oxidoreductase (luciferase family)